MRLGFLVFISLFLMADLLCWVISARWLRKQQAARWVRWVSHSFFSFQTFYIVFMIGSMLIGGQSRRGPDWLPTPVLALAYVWHIVGLPVLCVAIMVTAIIRRIVALVRWIWRKLRPSVAEQPPMAATPEGTGVSRRRFLAGSLAMVPPMLAVGATSYALLENGQFRIRRLRLPVAGLPKGLEGFRIAQVSDLHVGTWSTKRFLDEVVEATNAMEADVVLFTGDLIDIAVAELPRAIEVARRWRGRHGLFVIEGNHDLIDDRFKYWEIMRGSGLRFLRNEAAMLDHYGTPLQILGTAWSGRGPQMVQDIAEVAKLRDPAAYPILMAHHPHYFDAAAAAGFPLTLSGHTHGGQFALAPGLSAGRILFKYISGIYQKGDSKLLVSNGTGNWFPLRVNVPAEIIDITLTGA